MIPRRAEFLHRSFAWIAAAFLLASDARSAQTSSVGDEQFGTGLQQGDAVTRGRGFLINLFDPELNLLPEFAGSKTYWLFHDNYLAARALAGAKPELSRRIEAALVRFGVTNSGKIEIIFDRSPRALPFRTYQLTNVARIDNKQIRTEAVSASLFKRWEEYADLLFLASMAQASSASEEAKRNFDRGAAMWDGHGFNDRAAKNSGIYSTFKLALYLMAADRLAIQPPHAQMVRARLLGLQGKDGGWITDYKDDRPVGVANVETTCLAIFALEAKAR